MWVKNFDINVFSNVTSTQIFHSKIKSFNYNLILLLSVRKRILQCNTVYFITKKLISYNNDILYYLFTENVYLGELNPLLLEGSFSTLVRWERTYTRDQSLTETFSSHVFPLPHFPMVPRSPLSTVCDGSCPLTIVVITTRDNYCT